jgi:D-3-phosphoglycerate dehydrogenase
MTGTMNIAVLDDYQQVVRDFPSIRRLEGAGHRVTAWPTHSTDVDVLAGRLADADALMLIRERTPITEALLARLPKLRLISQFGVAPHIDLDACTRHGVLVCSRTVPGRPSYATAELTWGLVIAAARHIPQEVQALKEGRWQSPGHIGWTLRGRTLGVLGYGRIGGVVAGYGRAFGMRVLAWGREASSAAARADGHEVAGSLEALFEQSDVLTVHLPLVPASEGIVDAALLARMKPGALFVNTSRAGLVAPGALEAALKAGRPGAAALDVFEQEPLPPADPLLAMGNVLATPHIGYVEREGLEIMFETMAEQVLAFASGTPVNVLNPAARAG